MLSGKPRSPISSEAPFDMTSGAYIQGNNDGSEANASLEASALVTLTDSIVLKCVLGEVC